MSRSIDEPVCRRCGVIVTDHNRHPSHVRMGLRRCKACHKVITKAWAAAHKETVRAGARRRTQRRIRSYSPEQKRDYHLRMNYGLTSGEFSRMLDEQGQRCANPGCRTSAPKPGWHVDHNHETGRVRAVLCAECNRLLGAARESEAVLLGAVEYLRAHRHVTKTG